jgi:hypothetical protein
MELELKKLDEANGLAGKALEFSYGDNRLRAVHLLARILKGQGRAAEGRALIEKALATAALPKDESVRTHRYVKNLRELQKQLN